MMGIMVSAVGEALFSDRDRTVGVLSVAWIQSHSKRARAGIKHWVAGPIRQKPMLLSD